MCNTDNQTSDKAWKSETLEQTRNRLRRTWGDYPLTILVINPLSLRLVRIIGKTPITPNQLTILSFILTLTAALFIGSTQRSFQAFGGILLLIAYIIDCMDGDLARYKNLKSPLGAMLDPILDRFGEFAVIVALSLCGWRTTESEIWLIGGIFLAGMSQIYFYLVDAMVWKLPQNIKKNRAASSIRLLGTPVRFGAIEPFIWGLTILSLLGVAHWGIPIFSLMFTLGNLYAIKRVLNNSIRSKLNHSDFFGTHIR